MRVGILTSSRADFGIYLPLLKELKNREILFDIIAFGTHLSPFHGNTIDNIIDAGYNVQYRIESLVCGDSEEAISSSIALTSLKFSSFWGSNRLLFDYVICLGDRYEMFGAVMAGIPYNIVFVHLHGGEKTIGAIDNVFRHAISHASTIHFTSTREYAERLVTMLDSNKHIYNVGALSLDNLETIKYLSIDEFKLKWNVDFLKPTILTTFHPETVLADRNTEYAIELIKAIKLLLRHYSFLITMPNADTYGGIIRKLFFESFNNLPNVTLVENLGTQGYFSAMKHCSFLLGNTSSGIIEAASFNKYVINLGARQEGRIYGNNVLHVRIKKNEILKAVQQIKKMPLLINENKYFNGGAAKKIINILKKFKNDKI